MGGSYQVVRIIRFATRLWDLEPVPVQERVMGRRRDGTWLDGTHPTGRPGFDADPEGRITPLDAHTRRANPGSSGVAAPRMLRRGYSYHDGPEDQGMLFVASRVILSRGVQRRLAGQTLDRYTLTVGGGCYFLPDLSHGPANIAVRPTTFHYRLLSSYSNRSLYLMPRPTSFPPSNARQYAVPHLGPHPAAAGPPFCRNPATGRPE
ncbi:Dyp-type peroxidase [Nonomuraea guangzhouensis]|uniref:Dyp-type peroxidase n=1 Tax=Nonomuraea guangzhouensis TaxID=1291555 RepID=A0ABW4G7J6_9ACTN